jgi:hypothetical protein
VSNIISCFISSSVPPALQIDIPPGQACSILEMRKTLGPYIFREAQVHRVYLCLCLCLFIYVFVCVFVFISVWVYVFIPVCVFFVHLYIHFCVFISVGVRVYLLQFGACVYLLIYLGVFTRACADVRVLRTAEAVARLPGSEEQRP